MGNVALLKFYGTIGGGSWDSVTASWKVPEQYRPPMTLYVPLGCTNGASGTGQLMVGADGTLRAGNQGGAGSTDERWGAVTWCVAL